MRREATGVRAAVKDIAGNGPSRSTCMRRTVRGAPGTHAADSAPLRGGGGAQQTRQHSGAATAPAGAWHGQCVRPQSPPGWSPPPMTRRASAPPLPSQLSPSHCPPDLQPAGTRVLQAPACAQSCGAVLRGVQHRPAALRGCSGCCSERPIDSFVGLCCKESCVGVANVAQSLQLAMAQLPGFAWRMSASLKQLGEQ